MKKRLSYTLAFMWYLLSANTTFAFTHADTLRGSNGTGRKWWDVRRYELSVALDTTTRSIKGQNKITFTTIGTPGDSMQIDLQEPLVIDKVTTGNTELQFVKDGNVWWVKVPPSSFGNLAGNSITVYYHGKPRQAVNPPWDGGISWKDDANGKPWIAVSCQGLGASAWWPCKDVQWDEPDNGMTTMITVPGGLKVVSNGREDGKGNWVVKNPINNYDVTFYIGDYVHWRDTLMGEKGLLDLDFWALKDNETKARKQFDCVKGMIHCFEYWMGPYPFYEDGYKLVEAPYLGMEHQSAIAYGNDYKMGYKGYDRTMTGIGMNFDYIIIHESGHEWFGNNVTAKDIADNWVQEGITTFSESLYASWTMGDEKGEKYCRGEWHNIQNDKPIIGKYGVNEEGSNDMYDKGAAIMYMIRKMTNNDELFRKMLRGLGSEFYHQTVTTEQVEGYIAKQTKLDLKSFFDQYLRTAEIPQLEYYIKGGMLHYKFNNIVPGFSLPLPVTSGSTKLTISPTADWQEVKWKGGYDISISKDFLVRVKS